MSSIEKQLKHYFIIYLTKYYKTSFLLPCLCHFLTPSHTHTQTLLSLSLSSYSLFLSLFIIFLNHVFYSYFSFCIVFSCRCKICTQKFLEIKVFPCYGKIYMSLQLLNNSIYLNLRSTNIRRLYIIVCTFPKLFLNVIYYLDFFFDQFIFMFLFFSNFIFVFPFS